MARNVAQRRSVCFKLAALLAVAIVRLPALAQSSARRLPRIGFLGVTSAAGYARQIAAMQQGFRDLGYIEGQTILFEYRWADGQYDRLPALAADLIRLQPDVLVTSGPGTRVLKDATSTIPIVMAVGADAMADGLVESLARPGGNITGSTFFGPELSAKRLELLKEAVPRLSNVAILLNPENRSYRVDLEALKKAAYGLNIELLETPARSPSEFDEAFAQMIRRGARGVVVQSDSMFVANMRRLGELSTANRLPGAGSDEFCEGGGLLAYGVSFPALWRRAPYFVDRILKGVRPGDIPIEQPTKFELIVSLTTARALGITLPPSVLARADQRA
jgi:putative tryptophan/tyrosine transport system substrate-binding protein